MTNFLLPTTAPMAAARDAAAAASVATAVAVITARAAGAVGPELSGVSSRTVLPPRTARSKGEAMSAL